MLLIKNCKLVLGEYQEAITGVFKDLESTQDIFIHNEKILKIKSCIDLKKLIEEFNISSSLDEIKILDANFNYVIPGIVDVHTHMRDPGLVYKEDFLSGSKACAKGGVTTFIDMPNTIPPTTTHSLLMDKIENSRGRSYVDYGFHFGGSNLDNSAEIEKVNDLVASTKIFLNMSTGDMLINNNNSLENIFKSSKLISTHAEGDKVEAAILLAHKYNKPLYLCHISEKSELEVIKKYKDLGYEIYAEVTPHHIFLNETIKNSCEENKKLLIMKPELKSEVDNIEIIKAIKTGVIDTIGTDHAPHTIEDKNSKITFGIPGVENSLEIMLNLVKNGEITLWRLSQIMSNNPAKIFHIKNKGEIREGYLGDITIIDINDMYTLSNNNVISKCGWTPYNGVSTGGKLLTTIVRGEIVYNNGVFSERIIGKEISYNPNN